MNDKDKEAFAKWMDFIEVEWGVDGKKVNLFDRGDMGEAWKAACEYKKEKYLNIMDAMTQTSQNNFKLQAENAKLREALKNCPILGEVHRDSNDRFKEWNLEYKYILKELE